MKTNIQQQRRQPRNRDITIACDVTLNEVYTGKGVIATFRTNTGKEQTVNIDIPKGVRHGDTINYSGLGDDSIPNMPRGNLFVKVRIKRDPNFERDGYHLHTTVTVSVFDLMLGTATNLSLPNGRTISINIPQGTQPGNITMRQALHDHASTGSRSLFPLSPLPNIKAPRSGMQPFFFAFLASQTMPALDRLSGSKRI